MAEHLTVEKIDTPVMTPDQTLTMEDALNSVKVSLADLCAKGTSQFAIKNYSEAADYFARASELQAELNGEMDPQNAEILFLYGRSLFKVGQGKSDVLGAKPGAEKKRPKDVAKSKSKNGQSSGAAPSNELDKIAEEGVALVAEKNGAEAKQEEDGDPKKPLFQFTGDENFEDSDDDEEVRCPLP
jgi:HAT1-interacting factor 1